MKTNANLFRRMAAADDLMVRGAMPQTAAADPVVVNNDRVVVVVANRGGARLVRVAPVLKVTIGELVGQVLR